MGANTSKRTTNENGSDGDGLTVKQVGAVKLREAVKKGQNLPPFLTSDDIYHSTHTIPNWRVRISISDLRRKTGPRASKNEEEENFHQHHLTVAMRVNRICYTIAGPILYSRVITIRPDSFLSHVNPPISNRLSKIELFQYIHRMDIGYSPTDIDESDINPPLTRSDRAIAAGAGLFGLGNSRDGLYNGPTLIRDMDIAHRTTFLLKNLQESILPDHQHQGMKLFGNLQSITIGSFGQTPYSRWDVGHRFLSNDLNRYRLSSSSSSFYFSKLISTFSMSMSASTMQEPALSETLSRKNEEQNELIKIRYRFGNEFMKNCSPEHICVDNFSGPLSINDPLSSPSPSLGLKSYTIHITQSIVDNGLKTFPVVTGIINRWIIHPEAWDIWRGNTYRWLDALISFLFMDGIPKFSNTKVIIYGALDRQRIDKEFPSLVEDWDDNWEWEKKKSKVITWIFGWAIVLNLAGFVTLAEEGEVVCDACGCRYGGVDL
ncbi:uncharacterized protein IL334_003905 [Kwoniella shivajii]|uniref:Uncharacterized protein n=1 Tax=Kwoniella shivajii TaxID=564305 RepID=A0ABZ1CYW4_9TREE|nr:hypothetical protein IL334_003905 [Kwoniella shivajii]